MKQISNKAEERGHREGGSVNDRESKTGREKNDGDGERKGGGESEKPREG